MLAQSLRLRFSVARRAAARVPPAGIAHRVPERNPVAIRVLPSTRCDRHFSLRTRMRWVSRPLTLEPSPSAERKSGTEGRKPKVSERRALRPATSCSGHILYVLHDGVGGGAVRRADCKTTGWGTEGQHAQGRSPPVCAEESPGLGAVCTGHREAREVGGSRGSGRDLRSARSPPPPASCLQTRGLRRHTLH